ncbi:helix-turn-helix transcriptional regulator [Phytomonospora sp. NPDC050363]|uniref:helix-turn-helix domain-containing protein n=1 Tax=Phytomonospora sp. NPDC050363 TaxID=3155642 RepID=UPI003411C33B
MSEQRARSLRALWLGQRLKRIRVDAGMTLKQIGDYIRRDNATVSRIESGFLPARIPEVLAYLDLCGADDPRQREGLKRVSQEVFREGWWDDRVDSIEDEFVNVVWLESMANSIQSYEVHVPGLLQTRSYAEALVRGGVEPGTDSEIAEGLGIRMQRQERLTAEDPLRLSVVVDEVALRRPIGSARVMREQLQHLLDFSTRPNVSVRVLPLSAGAHPSIDGPFNILRIAEPGFDVAFTDTRAGTIVLESAWVETLTLVYASLVEMALGPKKSNEAIAAAIEEFA